jgi:hypothetical protein
MSAMSCTIERDFGKRSSRRYFALCELCFWIATILESRNGHSIIEYCPACLDKEKLSQILSLIPLGLDEKNTHTQRHLDSHAIE